MWRVNHRVVPADYQGPVFIWDIDKTYLDTRFSQLKGLLRIPFELGVDKREVPGAAALLRGLRRGLSGHDFRPLYFISASPHQLRGILERKMLLDGVAFDGITFKDPLRLLMRGEPSQLREQIAFKLSALLLLACELSSGSCLVLFGDDAERDALIYCLFADVAAWRLWGDRLERTLQGLGVGARYARDLSGLAPHVPRGLYVQRIYINLVRHANGSSIREFGAGIVGHSTATAAALDLHEQMLLSGAARDEVTQVAPYAEPVWGYGDESEEGFLTPSQYLAGA